MASISFKLVFLFILVSFFNFPTTEALFRPINCSEDTTTANSTYQVNLMTLLSSLSSKATVNTFYNNTVAGINAPNAVYGLFMCRGDVPSQLCGQCVLNATQTLSSECNLSKQAVVWYDECMVRYSDNSFFSAVKTGPQICGIDSTNITNQASFLPLLGHILNKTADEAAFSPTGDRYATKEANVSENQTLYCLAQCTRDLSPQNCRTCLANVTGFLSKCCEGKQRGRVVSPSCNVRYELYPFYRVNAPGHGGLVPATKYPKTDPKYSQDPGYLSHNCSSDKTIYKPEEFQRGLRTLLSYLSSNATVSSHNGFYETDVDEVLFGLFMCRGDIPPRLCGQCVLNSAHRIASECPLSAEAIVWYDHCLLRYSDQHFFYTMSTSPRFDVLNVTNINEEASSFKILLSNALAKVVDETESSDERYRTESFALNDKQTLYTLAQCTQDLSSNDCGGCLYDMIGSAIPFSRLGSVGGRVLYPSCTMRFELFQFYEDGPKNQPPPPPPPRPHLRSSAPASPLLPTEKQGRSRAIIVIVVPIGVLVTLFAFCCYLLRRKAKKSYKTILRENFGHESTAVEPLQFDLGIIEAATSKFANENRIGKGGFGEVYKGVLLDGRHIAVKRLSRSSTQGVAEFKNEVLLIAKLQHRNLVAFIGFCLEEQEKILIYEYVPNKSLDYFLFDVHSEKLLSWSERHKIIGGIARGILYLHEYSRLKVIHRDLKPSNILLDENMNPKISDFGLARIIEIDQHQGSTNKIVGSWGYMSPEYAMLGQFSEKSDVFSFGVMVLEIITGKKNVGSYRSYCVADGLLGSVWRQYRDQTPLSILDPKMKDSYSKSEVIRCIQIGLLCVQENPEERPTMTTVLSYLSNHLSELPSPQEPAFFLRGEMDPKISAWKSNSSSINEMSMTSFLPR